MRTSLVDWFPCQSTECCKLQDHSSCAGCTSVTLFTTSSGTRTTFGADTVPKVNLQRTNVYASKIILIPGENDILQKQLYTTHKAYTHINVNVQIYSPDIPGPVRSADCTIYTPSIRTHSPQSHLLGEEFSICTLYCSYSQSCNSASMHMEIAIPTNCSTKTTKNGHKQTIRSEDLMYAWPWDLNPTLQSSRFNFKEKSS